MILGQGFSLVATENQIEFSGGVSSLAEVATATTILTRVPSGAINGPVKVVANGVSQLSSKFTVLPSITGVSPAKAPVTQIFSVLGNGFDVVVISNNRVTIGGVEAVVTDATPSFLNVQVPVGAPSGPVEVFVSGVKAIGSAFLVVPPLIAALSPEEGQIATPVTIQGFGFSDNPGANAVKFNGTQATVLSSNYFSIETQVPPGTSTGKVTVTVSGETASSPADFVVNLPPIVTGFNPVKAVKGALISVLGQNFNGTPSKNVVTFGSYPALVQTATPTALGVVVPPEIPDQTPPLFITVTTPAGAATTPQAFEIDYPPVIEDFYPKTATAGTPIAIVGTNFFTTPSSNTVKIGGVAVSVLGASLTSLVVAAPQGAVGGPVEVTTPDGIATSVDLFQTVFPRFAFVTNSGDQTISFFVADAATGRLRHNGFRFAGAGKAPRGAAVSPNGQSLFVAHYGAAEVGQYAILPDGALDSAPASTVPAGTNPTAIAIHPGGQFAFVLNQASGQPAGSISQYTVQGGALIAQTPASVSSEGATPSALVIAPSGKHLYATNIVSGTVVAFSIGADGLLTSLGTVAAGPGSILQTGPSAILVHPNGQFAWVSNSNSNLIYHYSVVNGALVPLLDGGGAQITTASGTGPASMAFSPNLAFLYAANRTSNDVSIYQVNASTGALAPAGNFALPTVGASVPSPVGLTAHNGSLFVLGSGTTEAIQLSVDAGTGQLSLASQSRARTQPFGFAFANGATASKISTLSVHSANSGTLDTEAFSLDTGGVLTSLGVAGSATTGGPPPVWVGLHPHGLFYHLALLGNTTTNGTFGFGNLDPITGAVGSYTIVSLITGTAPNISYYNAKALGMDKSGRYLIFIGDKFSPAPVTTHISSITVDPLSGGFVGGTIYNLLPTAGKAQSLALDPTGRFAYVANTASSSVQGVAINGNTGALTNAQAALTVGAGTAPYAVTVHPSGRFVYLAYGKGTSTTQSDAVRTYLVSPTGALTLQQDAPLGALPYTDSGSSIAVDALGRFLFVVLADGSIQTWTIASNGTLSGPTTNSLPQIVGNAPYSLAADATGSYLFVANSADSGTGNNLVVCSILANGALSFASATAGVTGVVPKGVAVNAKVE